MEIELNGKKYQVKTIDRFSLADFIELEGRYGSVEAAFSNLTFKKMNTFIWLMIRDSDPMKESEHITEEEIAKSLIPTSEECKSILATLNSVLAEAHKLLNPTAKA